MEWCHDVLGSSKLPNALSVFGRKRITMGLDYPIPTASLAVIYLVPLLVWIAAADLRTREIPNIGSFCVASLGPILWWSYPQDLVWNVVVAGGIFVVLGVVGEEAWRRSGREWLGLGDAKLIGAGALVVGWSALWIMLLLACLGAICAVVAGGSRSRQEGVPFGPFLAYSILVTHLISGTAT